MKTIELKWIEDDNHVVAEDAFTGLKELIETGVFPNLKVKCEDDTLFITGEKEDLDKAVAKIQKDYLKYGQIAIKENLEKATAMCIESFDDNVRDIFEHTLNEYNDFKNNTFFKNNTNGNKPVDYVTKLGQFQFKFNKFKQVANTKHDKDIIQGFLTEIGNLSEQAEIRSKIKPVKRKINEGYFNESIESNKKLYKKLIIDQLSKLENWGMIEEKAYDDRPRKIKSRAELVRKALKQNATEITEYEELLAIKESQLMNELAYSMDINGNKTGAIWVGDRDGKFYYCTNQGILIRT